MSQHQNQSDDSINANVVAFVIMTFFVLISILLISQLPKNITGQKVALAEATVEARPSATPLPPTLTPTPPPTQTPTVMPSATPTEPPPATATTAPTVITDAGQTNSVSVETDYDPALIARGQEQFLLCSACHGPDARGLPNLGKDLVASEFVHSQTDEELLTFIKTGRPIWDPLNTTGIDMPPKGGNPAMTDDDILAVIAYVRSLAGTASTETTAGTVQAAATSEATVDAGVPASANAVTDYDPALVARGQEQFMLCAACHGPDARGLPNLGKDLVASEFVHSQTDEELLTFVKTGRPIWDPLNTTGIDMPPKGGNPAMTDDDILAVIAYVRSLAAGAG